MAIQGYIYEFISKENAVIENLLIDAFAYLGYSGNDTLLIYNKLVSVGYRFVHTVEDVNDYTVIHKIEVRKNDNLVYTTGCRYTTNFKMNEYTNERW